MSADSLSSVELSPDPVEVAEVQWIAPSSAIAQHNESEGKFILPPPTYVMMDHLKGFNTVDELMHHHRALYGQSVDSMPRVEPVLTFEGPDGKPRAKPLKNPLQDPDETMFIHHLSGATHLQDGVYRDFKLTLEGPPRPCVIHVGPTQPAL